MILSQDSREWKPLPRQPAPAGIFSDFVGDQGFKLRLTSGLCLSIVLIFAGVRFYSKVFILQSKSPDDCAVTCLPISFCDAIF